MRVRADVIARLAVLPLTLGLAGVQPGGHQQRRLPHGGRPHGRRRLGPGGFGRR
ncbi:MAG: hypothetical protein V9G10_03190 [Candidatus Nanopelagicales bacterium]